MEKIKVISDEQNNEGWKFTVAVKNEKGETLHGVTFALELFERRLGKSLSPLDVIVKSFDFLLKREP